MCIFYQEYEKMLTLIRVSVKYVPWLLIRKIYWREKTMLSKRILTMQDLSCVGQCSLTVVLPVLSAYGIETCVLPTAILSNHTAFDKWSCLDLSFEMDNILKAWQENNFMFDAFLGGYLGSAAMADVAKICFQHFMKEGAPIIIDPVFGDNGKLYAAFDSGYVAVMADLIKSADIILPNLTEACFLTGIEYQPEVSTASAKEIVKRLAECTPAAIVLTGVEHDGEIGELIYADGEFSEVWAKKLPQRFHGTGDLFASAFTALYLQGSGLTEACEAAGNLVAAGINATDGSHIYGVNFEYALKNRIRC